MESGQGGESRRKKRVSKQKRAEETATDPGHVHALHFTSSGAEAFLEERRANWPGCRAEGSEKSQFPQVSLDGWTGIKG